MILTGLTGSKRAMKRLCTLLLRQAKSVRGRDAAKYAPHTRARPTACRAWLARAKGQGPEATVGETPAKHLKTGLAADATSPAVHAWFTAMPREQPQASLGSYERFLSGRTWLRRALAKNTRGLGFLGSPRFGRAANCQRPIIRLSNLINAPVISPKIQTQIAGPRTRHQLPQIAAPAIREGLQRSRGRFALISPMQASQQPTLCGEPGLP